MVHCYKVVRLAANVEVPWHGHSSTCIASEYQCEYQLDHTTRARCGYLFVFGVLSDAVSYARSGYRQVVCRCLAPWIQRIDYASLCVGDVELLEAFWARYDGIRLPMAEGQETSLLPRIWSSRGLLDTPAGTYITSRVACLTVEHVNMHGFSEAERVQLLDNKDRTS